MTISAQGRLGVVHLIPNPGGQCELCTLKTSMGFVIVAVETMKLAWGFPSAMKEGSGFLVAYQWWVGGKRGGGGYSLFPKQPEPVCNVSRHNTTPYRHVSE